MLSQLEICKTDMHSDKVRPVQHTGFKEDMQALAHLTQCTQQILRAAALEGSYCDR
jgi:hypothetical protein